MNDNQDILNNKENPHTLLPVLPLRDVVVFPGLIVTLYVGRNKSLKAIDFATTITDHQIVLVAQKDAALEEPTLEDIYNVGVIGNIIQLLRLTDGTLKLLIESSNKIAVDKYTYKDDVLVCQYTIVEQKAPEDDVEVEALARSVKNDFEYYSKYTRRVNPDLQSIISSSQDHLKLLNLISYHLPISLEEKQKLLEINDLKARFLEVLTYLQKEISLIDTEHKIKARVKKQMEKTQREYYLNEQMKAIQQELGEVDDLRNDIKNLEQQINNTQLSKEAREKLLSEVKKLKMMNAMSAEASVIRNYIELVLSLPWGIFTKNKIDLNKAEKILDQDHHGLDKVKERIIEYLAVQKRINSMKSPILCLVGPPGVGKTSLGKSIAKATGRKYIRISLGGVRDEAEIRGHRKTYVGAMPGKIITSIKKAKSANPLILLDEIDKMGMDFRGDPTAALLEVLDPAQNASFVDHYLEVEFDLSKVMFVATANSTNLPRPLLDRMEVIRLSGYTEDEKLEIAEKHLIPKLCVEHGIKTGEIEITKDAIIEVIRYYTREAGVRNLERELAKIIRKALRKILNSKDLKSISINQHNIEEYSGVRKFLSTEARKENYVGLTNGLAYTEAGGELLYIEAVKIPGKGLVKVTGKLGEVMQESAQAAVSYVKSRAKEFGILPSVYQNYDIHIHVPEGATPKDGPSAGIAIATTTVSLLTNIPVKQDVAMTGEITLSGRVLAIGGLKEKLLAASRSGIKTVIIPEENKKDLIEIPDIIKNSLSIKVVNNLSEVLDIALTKAIVPLADDHPEIVAINNPKLVKGENGNDMDNMKRH